MQEEERVATAVDSEMPIKVLGFRKVYTSVFRTPVVAVENVSFGLDYGECFALLGVNGAGNTTTFKALTRNDSTQSEGSIMIEGRDLNKNFNSIRRLLGYCP